ncbi:MAG TPA: ribonuclease III [Candidatus Saccharimonadales bacterium]|nr:ribonuclease III [Candidatus Saccharimonadales bacterium]
MDSAPYQQFAQDVLHVDFADIELLVTAFTHRSYLNEHKKSVKEHNERLEFLGDAVLELVVTEYLYGNYSEPEGILTNWRSSLVRTESISAAAAKCGFEPLLRLSRGEKRGSERARSQILANSFEAVIGAIYLDQGYDAAKIFITDNILSTLQDILATGSWMDPKSHLQELAQSHEGATPLYKVMAEEGPDHDKVFTVGVYVDNKLRGQGVGPSKQAGQQAAAEAALKFYQNTKS